MGYRHWAGMIGLAAALSMPVRAQAFDDSKYPDLKGVWTRVAVSTGAERVIQYDPSKRSGRAQEAPLKPEYQAIFEANLAEVAQGGSGEDPVHTCIPEGMPRAMNLVFPMEIVIKRDTTYIVTENPSNFRRIYTDGRAWPAQITPSYLGYSIGTWVDENHDGRLDALMVETRGLKGPRSYDSSGMPFHRDGETVIKERIFPDRANGDIVHDEITTIDHALTRPWTVTRSYRRVQKQIWIEINCAEDNHQVRIGAERYYVSGDGYLMPTHKDQPAPELKGFDRARQ